MDIEQAVKDWKAGFDLPPESDDGAYEAALADMDSEVYGRYMGGLEALQVVKEAQEARDSVARIRALKEQDYKRAQAVAAGYNDDENNGFPERSVLDRVINGRDMAALALTGSSYMAYEDYETGLIDALTNLMHFARRYEIDFDASLSSARNHHEYEAKYGWDEVPDA